MHADAALATPLPADFEEYRIVRPLGRGAMGEVFLAHDTALDRPVAIKLAGGAQPDSQDAVASGLRPPAGPAASGLRPPAAAVRERFFAEARALARVRHPNVIAIHRVGEVRGRPYLVAEYVAGESLDSVVGPVREAVLLGVARGLAAALSAVHGAGVLHRDIKPANVVLGSGGAVKLVDFGLAEVISWGGEGESPGAGRDIGAGAPSSRLLGGGVDPTISLQMTQIVEPRPAVSPPPDRPAPPDEQAPSTRRYRMAGTPLYMAPEMWRGAKASARTDIYALGATLYKLATGEAPFARTPCEGLLAAKIDSRPAPVIRAAPGLSPALAAVIDKAMAPSPEERYPSADALLSALLSLTPVPVERRRLHAGSSRPSSRRPVRSCPSSGRPVAHFKYPLRSAKVGASGRACPRCAP